MFVCFQGDRHDAAGHSLPVLGPDREALLEEGAQPDRVVLVCSHLVKQESVWFINPQKQDLDTVQLEVLLNN